MILLYLSTYMYIHIYPERISNKKCLQKIIIINTGTVKWGDLGRVLRFFEFFVSLSYQSQTMNYAYLDFRIFCTWWHMFCNSCYFYFLVISNQKVSQFTPSKGDLGHTKHVDYYRNFKPYKKCIMYNFHLLNDTSCFFQQSWALTTQITCMQLYEYCVYTCVK